ncbi:MAG: hypothetical protein MI924_39490, partial [Chloroflexales bacterium]|nr:hypothetical protein [Chloroflexales bacterium]
ARALRDDIQHNAVFTLDLLGTNIERGIDRAKQLGLNPSVFNIGNWLWNGVQEPWRIWRGIADGKPMDDEGVGYSHGLAMVDIIDDAATVLNIPLGPHTAYNRAHPPVDESVLVECRLRYGVRLFDAHDIFYQEPACGPRSMFRSEFMRRYGQHLNEVA